MCTHAPFYKRLPMYVCVFTMEAFVSTKRQSHLSRRAYAFISSFYCRRTVDRKRNRLEQTNDATVTMTQTQLPFSPSFTFDCKDDKQSYRHLNQRADGHRQACRTTNTPKRIPPSLRVCFTFNDAHIRELGGSLLPLPAHVSAPDNSLASDSQ